MIQSHICLDIPHTNYGQVEKIDGSTVQTHTFTNFPNPDDSEEDDKSDVCFLFIPKFIQYT